MLVNSTRFDICNEKLKEFIFGCIGDSPNVYLVKAVSIATRFVI